MGDSASLPWDLWTGLLRPGEQPLATTHLINGERLTREALVNLAGDVDEEPVMLNIEHIRGVNPSGWIRAARLVELPDGEWGLVARQDLLGQGDFLSPGFLRVPASTHELEPDDGEPVLAVSVDDRDFEMDALNEIQSMDRPGDLQIEASGNDRRYSADPVVVVSVAMLSLAAASKFASSLGGRLGERVADEVYDKVKQALGRLPEHLRPNRGGARLLRH